ncbi:MAG: polyprenyl synthetase family protein [Jiangellales bacterium]
MDDTRSISVPDVDSDLSTWVAGALAEVESGLSAAVEVDDGLLDSSARHLLDAGGKRFRPMMVLLAAQLGDPDAPGVIPSALVVELTHLATLYHDDVMDEAAVRRGVSSANTEWGNTVAILTGDYLFARASELVADLGPDAVRLQSRTFARLVRGQIRETIGPAGGDDPVQHYLDVLADKTGSLIATSARFGAWLSGAPDDHVELVTRFGEAIGIAFQLADDVIDVASESAESGKTPGTDLREGVPTLPSLYALRSTAPADQRLVALLSDKVADDDVDEALALLRAHPALTEARREVRRWSDLARDELVQLPDTAARAALLEICDSVVSRTT